MRAVLVMAVVVVGCALAGAFSPARPGQPPGALPAPRPELYGVPRPGDKPRFAHLPATSCAAAACHGGGQIGKPGSEHSTWAPQVDPSGGSDPHSRAYSVLFNADSVRMGKLLGVEPHKSELCLKCHAPVGAGDAASAEQVRAEGVGCGACHGPAEKWVAEHYTPKWKTLSPREKWHDYGFVPAGNLVARTLNCASCHVGDADREVNHDLIAAGHPRLAFEAARFHHTPNYRTHWVEKTPQPDFEVRVWAVGQAATLRAATLLLHQRATRAAASDKDTPWPEFAGYSCYSCHQKVGDEKLRRETSVTARPAGAPGWEVWSTAAFDVAVKSCGEAYPGLSSSAFPEVAALRKLMESSRAPAPKRVAEQAAKALAELDAWLVALQAADDDRRERARPAAARTLARALAANALSPDGAKLADHDWDALAANYLGCAAMYHASGGAASVGTWTGPLTDVRDGLRFPPARERGARFDSPAHFDRDTLIRLTKDFGRLRDATATSGGGKR